MASDPPGRRSPSAFGKRREQGQTAASEARKCYRPDSKNAERSYGPGKVSAKQVAGPARPKRHRELLSANHWLRITCGAIAACTGGLRRAGQPLRELGPREKPSEQKGT